MSKYAQYATTFKDGGHLAAALTEMGFVIECHEEAQTLYGYHDDARPEKAHIIIRRQNTGIGASNDIGFLRVDGEYRAIISEYDRGCKFDDSWLGKLKQVYAEKRTIAQAKAKGYIFQGREIIGKSVKLRFAVR